MKTLRVDIDPYDATLYFTTSRKTFLKLRARYTANEVDLANTVGMASNFNDGSTHIVGVFNGRASTFAHEMSHVVFTVLAARDIPISADNSEVFCYLLGNLMDKCRPCLGKLS